MARPNKSGREYNGKGTSKAERGETMSFFISFDTRDQRRYLDRLARHYGIPKRYVVIFLIEEAYRLAKDGKSLDAAKAVSVKRRGRPEVRAEGAAE